MNKPRQAKVTKDDLDRLKRGSVDLPGLIEFAHSVGGFAVTPTNEGAIKKQALTAMQEQTEDKLGIIYEQMKTLARQAREIQDRVSVSEKIYLAKFKFEPVMGKTYYLYAASEGKYALSLIAPNEWSKECPLGEPTAKVKLLADHTWKIEEKYNGEFAEEDL